MLVIRGRNTALYTDYRIIIAELCRPPTRLTRADGRLLSFLRKKRVHKNAICVTKAFSYPREYSVGVFPVAALKDLQKWKTLVYPDDKATSSTVV